MSRGRASNHLYLVGTAEIDDTTGHGPPALTGHPVQAVQHALHRQGEKRLAIDTGEPLAFWDIEDLVSEKHRLHRVLADCPPDRTHDIDALVARQQQLAEDIEPLVYRYNELADRKLRGPGTRTEMRELRDKIGEGSGAVDRISSELHDAQDTMTARERFQAAHAGDSAFLEALEHELGRQISDRVNVVMADPSDYHRRVLGPVPTDPEHQATWKRGASILVAAHLGVDIDPTDPRLSSLLGPRRDAAQMRARLEVMTIPREREPVGRGVDQDLGLSL
jgi:hypothetical protein